MPLSTCRECAASVSTEAVTCPHCGIPRPVTPATVAPARDTGMSAGTVLFIVLALGLAGFMALTLTKGGVSAAPEGSPQAFVQEVKDGVRALLSEPGSAKFGIISVFGAGDSMVACGSVTAKGAGAAMQKLEFISFGGGQFGTLLEGRESPGVFQPMYRTACFREPAVHTEMYER